MYKLNSSEDLSKIRVLMADLYKVYTVQLVEHRFWAQLYRHCIK